jgi:uncharacterized protein (TIGR02598 family)
MKAATIRSGFTLVEVVLALGIASFVIISLVPLLLVSLSSAQKSIDFTRRSQVIQQVASELTQSQFATTTTSATWYFDAEGIETNEAAAFFTVKSQYITVGITLPGSTGPAANLNKIALISSTPKPNSSTTNYLTIVNCGY